MAHSHPQYLRPSENKDDRGCTTTPDIAEKLARTFSQIASNEHYSHEFIRHKNAIEQRGINFNSNNTETYNRDFTTEELQHSLSLTRNTTPGFDGVHDQIKKMPIHAKRHLCNIFNKFWHQSYFPQQWNKAIFIPIHKPGKKSQ